MKCPKCGHNYCKVCTESETTGKDYSIGKGLVGEALFGSPGFILGFSKNRKTEVKAYWICEKCGTKFVR